MSRYMLLTALLLAGFWAETQAWRFKVVHPHRDLHWPDPHDMWSDHHRPIDDHQPVHSLDDWNSFFDDPFFQEQIWPWSTSRGNCGNRGREESEKDHVNAEVSDDLSTNQPDDMLSTCDANTHHASSQDFEEQRQVEDTKVFNEEKVHDGMKDTLTNRGQANFQEKSSDAQVSNTLSDTEKLIEQKKAEIRKLEELLALERQKEELLKLQRREAELNLQLERQAKQLEREYSRQNPVRYQEHYRNDEEMHPSQGAAPDNYPSKQNLHRPTVDYVNAARINILNRKDNPKLQENTQNTASCRCGRDKAKSPEKQKVYEDIKHHQQRSPGAKHGIPAQPSRDDKFVYRTAPENHRHRQQMENQRVRKGQDEPVTVNIEKMNSSSRHPEPAEQIQGHQRVPVRTPAQQEATRRQRAVTIAQLDVPGYFPKDIQVHTIGSKVHVHGAQACSCSDSCVAREFERILPLPEGVDTRTVEASLDKDARLLIKGTSFLDGQVSRQHREIPVAGVGIPMHQPIPMCNKDKKGYTAGKINARTGERYVAKENDTWSDIDDITIETVEDY